jgi:hypothetical protein
VDDRLTLVSEFDFKGRLIYQELECLFKRPFETELLDNLEILQQLLPGVIKPEP